MCVCVCVLSLICHLLLTTVLEGSYYYYPHYTDEETEAQID